MILLSTAYFGLIMTLNTIATWTPQIVKEIVKEHGSLSIGMLTALPALIAALSMPLWSAHSDRTQRARLAHRRFSGARRARLDFRRGV